MNRKFADNGLDKAGGLHNTGDPEAGAMSHSATFNNYKQHVKSQYQYSSQQGTGQKAVAMTPQKEQAKHTANSHKRTSQSTKPNSAFEVPAQNAAVSGTQRSLSHISPH